MNRNGVMQMTWDDMKKMEWAPDSAMAKIPKGEQRETILFLAKQFCEHRPQVTQMDEERTIRGAVDFFATEPGAPMPEYINKYRIARAALEQGEQATGEKITLAMGGELTTDTRSLSGEKTAGFLKDVLDKGSTTPTQNIVDKGRGKSEDITLT